MAALGNYLQQPAEKLKYTVNYSEWLGTSESIASSTVTVTPTTTTPLVVSDKTDAATSVSFFVEGGEEGTNYVLTIRVTTSVGQIKEDEIFFNVTDVK